MTSVLVPIRPTTSPTLTVAKKPIEHVCLGIRFTEIEFAYMKGGKFWVCYECAALVVHDYEYHAKWHKRLDGEEWQ